MDVRAASVKAKSRLDREIAGGQIGDASKRDLRAVAERQERVATRNGHFRLDLLSGEAVALDRDEVRAPLEVTDDVLAATENGAEHEDVVAVAAEQRVIADTSNQRIVAAEASEDGVATRADAADQQVAIRSAGDQGIAGAAKDRVVAGGGGDRGVARTTDK